MSNSEDLKTRRITGEDIAQMILMELYLTQLHDIVEMQLIELRETHERAMKTDWPGDGPDPVLAIRVTLLRGYEEQKAKIDASLGWLQEKITAWNGPEKEGKQDEDKGGQRRTTGRT